LNNRKSTAVPFQEGYLPGANGETHVFTDYRWNDETVTRRWVANPHLIDMAQVIIRPFDFETDQVQ